MTVTQQILEMSIWFGLAVLSLALLLTVWRVIRGPTLPDRVIALDMLVGIVIGFIALIAIKTGFTLYIDIAIALGLVGFLATVALARFILARGQGGDDAIVAPRSARPVSARRPAAKTTRRKTGGKPAGKGQKS